MLWEEAVAVTPLPDDSTIKIIMESAHQIALGCGLVFFVAMLTPELGRVSVPYQINFGLSLVNSLAWLIACVLLNMTMLTDKLDLWNLRKHVHWDLFISYRQRTEKDLAERLHDKLCAERVGAWLDQKNIDDGDKWANAFVDGLFGSRIFTPLLSRKSLAPMRSLKPTSPCDNLLLEYRIALELYKHHEAYCRPPLKLLPVFIGDRTNEIAAQLEPVRLPPPGKFSLARDAAEGHERQMSPRASALSAGMEAAGLAESTQSAAAGVTAEPSPRGRPTSYDSNYGKRQRQIKLSGEFYTEFDIGQSLGSLPDVVVKTVDDEVARHLERFWEKVPAADRGGKRPPMSTRGQTVKQTVEALLEFQAIKMESMGKKQALEHCVRSLLLKHMKLAADERKVEEERVNKAVGLGQGGEGSLKQIKRAETKASKVKITEPEGYEA